MGEFDGMMGQSVTINGFNSVDQYGDISWNTNSTTYAAKIDLRIKVVRDFKGNEAVSTCLICLPSTYSPDLFGRDRITLPAAYGSKTPVVLAIEDAIDPETGINDHWEVST